MKNFFVLCFLFFLSLSLFPQAQPPERINYQGVLRDASGNPLNGNYTMVFRFYNASTGSTLLWEEIYDNGLHPPQVSISNGLFSVQLGDPSHRNAGSETNFRDLFSKYTDVYLSVQVGTDTEMTPRIKVISSAYSQNANTFDGRNSDYFLDISSTIQTKTGKVIFNASSGDYGVEGYGPTAGGYFKDSTQSGYAYVGFADTGIDARGNISGGYFMDYDSSGYAYVGYGDYGIRAYGNSMGGYFNDRNNSSVVNLAYGDTGIEAYGNTSGGYFKDSDSSGYAYVGYGDRGIDARGNIAGAYFSDLDSSGYAYVGYGDRGIDARGNAAGGYFANTTAGGTAYAYIGYLNAFLYEGIHAEGTHSGGYFKDSNDSGYANIGYGDTGIDARGNAAGGFFANTTAGGTAYAYLGYLNVTYYRGIYAEGTHSGGYFKDSNQSGYANIGYGDTGIDARGTVSGGYFIDTNSSGYAYVGYGDYGTDARGDTAGGHFEDLNSTSYSNIGYSTFKVFGTGTVSFVQNHPYEKEKVIVYAAPEGDEVATYTRGTGRLINGQARIKLGETFKWVTNPDIGLTAHLTPREKAIPLAVVSLSTDELVVKGTEDVQFDYIVYGLRVGFEETSIVQEKQIESYIPSFKDHRERYIKYPELRSFNAFERFKNMEAEAKGISKDQIDLSRAIALKEAIHEYDPEKDPPADQLFGHQRSEEPSNEMAEERTKEEGIQNAPVLIEKEIKEKNKREIIREEKIIKEEDDLSCFLVYGQVEEGDVLVMNIQNGSSLVLSNKEYDPMVVGVVSKEKECRDGKIYVKTSGVAYIKVDANVNEIKKGDLLVTSQTLGYGMKSENPKQGTVIGKALENLEGGTGKIKVLLMAR